MAHEGSTIAAGESVMEEEVDECEACGCECEPVVHSFGCIALCEECSVENGEPHCPRTHANHESDPCEWCVGYWQEIDDEKEVDAAVAEIAENWHSTEQDSEAEQEFLDELHDPTLDARSLLDGQFAVPRTLTEEQWGKVLSRVRELFPMPVVCSGCGLGFPVAETTQHPSGALDGSTVPYCRECENADW